MKRHFTAIVFLVFAWLPGSQPTFAATYYLRADGTVTATNKANATGCGSASTAMNFTQQNAATFAPGDRIVLCDSGGAFSPVTDAALIPPSSGTSASPISYVASGRPVINGGVSVMSGWAQTWPGNLVGGGLGSQANTWAAPLATQPYWVMFNGSNGTPRSSLASLANNMDWYWSSGYLFTYRTDNANPGTVYSSLVAAQGQYCIEDANSANFIIVDGIGCTLANARGISSLGSNWTIENCDVTYTGNGVTGYGHGILAEGNGALVTGCTLNYLNCYGIAFTGSGDVASHNRISHCWNGLSYAQGGNGPGIDLEGASGEALDNFIDTSFHCVTDMASTDSLIADNLCVTWGTNGIDHEEGTSGHPARIYNNTIIHTDASGWGSGHGIVCQNSGNYADIENNIVVVNGTQSNVNYEAIAFDGASQTGITLDHNLYYLAPGTTGTVGESPSLIQYSTLAAWQAAISGIFTGGDAHSIASNPLLANGSGAWSAAADFKIERGSPAIGAGANVGVRRDYRGKAVPGPFGVSLGAYEFRAPAVEERPYHSGWSFRYGRGEY